MIREWCASCGNRLFTTPFGSLDCTCDPGDDSWRNIEAECRVFWTAIAHERAAMVDQVWKTMFGEGNSK